MKAQSDHDRMPDKTSFFMATGSVAVLRVASYSSGNFVQKNIYSRLLSSLISLVLLLPVSAQVLADLPVRNDKSPMGINVQAIADWSPELPFVDVFRTARPFAATTPNLSLDEHGWPKSLAPGQSAETFMVWDMDDVFPYGNYTVLFDGSGEMSFGSGARVTDRKEGRYQLNVNPREGGIHLKITRTDPADPIRNIRVIMPGGICSSAPLKRVERAEQCKNNDFEAFVDTYETQIFNPDFLNLLADFKVLRFLDFLKANNSAVVNWSDRGKMDDATWSTRAGGPIEILVELSNRMHADPWLTIPHQAGDEYVEELAKFLKENLDDGLTVYVEYSNEIWNSAFRQFRYMIEKGQAQKLSGDQYQAGLRYFSKRSVQIFKLFEQVFGGTERLVRVMPGQAANDYVVQEQLSYEKAYEYTDAIALAPYFGASLGAPGADTDKFSVAKLFAKLRKDALPEAIDWMQKHARVASKYKLDMLAYEGGQHLVGYHGQENNKKLDALFAKADVNFQMGSLYDRYFAEWKKAGGKTFVYYASVTRPSKWGRWGIANKLNTKEGESPKKDAVLRFIKDNPQWW